MIKANLFFELDALGDEIEFIISRQHYGVDWALAGVIDESSAQKIMNDAVGATHECLKNITVDYGSLLSKNDIKVIKERIVAYEHKVKREVNFECLKPIVEQEYVDELGQPHSFTEKDFKNNYNKRLKEFSAKMRMQRVRLENYYERMSSERRKQCLRTWIPIIISVAALVISIIALFAENAHNAPFTPSQEFLSRNSPCLHLNSKNATINPMRSRISLQPGASPSIEEISTANFLTAANFTGHVTFIAETRIKNQHTPDIDMNNLRWEIKHPVGTGSTTIRRLFKTATRQSENIIFDLRRSKMCDSVNIARLKKEFHDIKSAKRLLIITKTKKLLEYYK